MKNKILLASIFLFFIGYSSLHGATKNKTQQLAKQLDVTLFGVKGDGITDNTLALDNLIKKAKTINASLYFPHGTYIYNKDGMDAGNIRFIGESKANTIIKEIALKREHNLDGAENISFSNFDITDKNTSKSRAFRNCKFEITLPVKDDYILMDNGRYTFNESVEFTNCDFSFPRIWVALFVRKYSKVLVSNCTFNGDAWHNIRLEEPMQTEASVKIIGNEINGGTTGVFVTPSRNVIMKGGLIQGNKLMNQKEEAIAFDGFGNDPNMIPVIANGTIARASNDAEGHLVVGMDSLIQNGGTKVSLLSRDNWTNFYYSFGEGSGMEGALIKIKDFNLKANTLTLDTIYPSKNVNITGRGGVQGGFFNWTIRNNSISGTLGVNNTYGTAISVYLNVFGMLIENNMVTNCAHGLNLAGGTMLTYYHSLAYNNIVRNNTFINCDKYGDQNSAEGAGVVSFVSYNWGRGDVPLQYNNVFENNTVLGGGRVLFQRQRNLINRNNSLSPDVKVIIDDVKLK